MDFQYARAPILEAVIELRFASPLERSLVNELANRFSAEYSRKEEQTFVDIRLESLQSNPEILKNFIGYKFSSDDQTDNLLVQPISFSCTRLAPYLGWRNFADRMQRDWSTYTQIIGSHPISRIGIRYINRIDVPTSNGATDISEFLRVYPGMPSNISIGHYAMQVISSVRDGRFMLQINTGSTPSPILNTHSFLLDIDVSTESDVPQEEILIYSFLEDGRVCKNEIFEACITEKSREIFGK